MQPVRLGVVGCGVIGPHHMAGALKSPLVELVAVADLIGDRAQTAAEKFSVPKTYIEGNDLIEDPDVEAVVLALPACGRLPLALHAFSRGKHVLTEKPVAMCAEDVEKMIDERGDLVAACCSSRYRLVDGGRAAAEFIATGALGDLRSVFCRSFVAAGPPPQGQPPEWRLKRHLNAGGILTNWGCYDLDYLLGITGWSLRPRTCFAKTWTVPPQFEGHIAPGSDAETHYIALIDCEGGIALHIERGEYMPVAAEVAWQIIGTKGSLRLTMTQSSPKRILFDDASTEQGVQTKTVWEQEEPTDVMSERLLTDFASAIREGHRPETDLERALVIAQISDAIYRSAASGTAVPVG